MLLYRIYDLYWESQIGINDKARRRQVVPQFSLCDGCASSGEAFDLCLEQILEAERNSDGIEPQGLHGDCNPM